MRPEQWNKAVDLFHAAREKSGGERVALLESACAGNAELQQTVEQMLRDDEASDGFLSDPPWRVLAPESPRFDPSLRPKFGRYEIVAPLGRGGMGEVWQARDTELDRRVALKFLAPASPFDPAGDRLAREARAASALDHPNIVAVHEIFHDEATPVLVMELVEGTSLRTLVETPQPVECALGIARQIAQALAAAHAHGIIHRDIKPENIIVRDDGYVKVLDFGLARRLSHESVSTVGILAGTLRYMSPEQARGDAISPASDIFSFGLVLYELLTGAHPFPAESPIEAAHAIQAEEPLPPSSLNPLVPPPLDSLILGMLAKDARSRLSAAEVDRKLGEIQLGKAELVARTSDLEVRGLPENAADLNSAGLRYPAPPRARSQIQNQKSNIENALVNRHKIAAAIAAVIIAAVAYSIYALTRKAPVEVPLAEMQITQLTHTGKVGFAAISPDGNYMAYTTGDPGEEALWVERLATGSNVQILPLSGRRYTGLTYSPDGRSIYFVDYPAPDASHMNLYRISEGGGQPKEIIAGVNSPVAISPDGKRAAFFHYDPATAATSLIAADIDSGAERVLVSPKLPNYFQANVTPAWSPDGKLIAAPVVHPFNRRANATILVVTAGEKLKMDLHTHFWLVQDLAWRADGRSLAVLAEQRNNGPSQLWELSYPSGQARRITNDLSSYWGLSLAADSKALVSVQQTILSNIWVAPSGDSIRARQITFGTGGVDGFESLAWMPDGSIAYGSMATGKAQIRNVGIDGNQLRGLFQGTRTGEFELAGCGSGQTLVFESLRSGRADIWKSKADGSDPVPLTSTGGAGTPACSPDGKWVVFISWLAGPQALWKVPISGGKPLELTSYESAYPAISPDGKWIAFLEAEKQESKIALIPMSGGEPVKTFSFNAAPAPRTFNYLRWSPDGREIDYEDIRNGVSNIWAQPISGGQPRAITHFNSDYIYNFAWSTTGDLALSRGTTTSDAVLIRNF